MERYPPAYTEDWGIGAGPQCNDFEVSEEAWNFFKSHVLREERVYRPTDACAVVGSGDGDVTDLWRDEEDGSNQYLVDDDAGTSMLQATFTIPDPQPIDSLRLHILYRNTTAVTHTIHLWNYSAGPSGSWEHVGTDPYIWPGIDGTVNQTVTSPSQYVDAQRKVKIALSADSPNAHQLSIAMMEIGVTLKDLGTYAAGDSDHDGTVDGKDLCALAMEYGKEPCTVRCSGDCNGDDAVDAADVTIFSADFGQNIL
jgi:hypothetical protein